MKVFVNINPGGAERRQMADDNKGGIGMRVGAVKRMRVGNQHPVYVVDVGKRSDACLVHYEKYQQAQCAYNFFLLLHVQKSMF